MKIKLDVTAASNVMKMGNCPKSAEWQCGVQYRTV